MAVIGLLLLNCTAGAQGSGSERYGGIMVTAKAGISALMTEIYQDLSGSVNEFNNSPGPAYGIELSMFLTPGLETGAGISYYTLNGRADVPDFSAIGHQYHMEQPLKDPVQYNNRMVGPELFVRYHFGRNRIQPLSAFIETGTCALTHHSELIYSGQQEEEVLFGKGRGSFKDYRVTNMMFSLGGGMNYRLSRLVGLKLSARMNAVRYDLLDVVHNFDTSGNRREVIGLFSNLNAGVTFIIPVKKKHQPLNATPENHLPFSPGM